MTTSVVRQPAKSARITGVYWLRLLLAAILALIFAIVATVVGVSYQQTIGYLHPERSIPSSDFLGANEIQFQDVELITEDGIKLAAWYTPPKNAALILIAHGYGDKRPEEFYTLFANHGYGVIAWDFRAHGKSGGDFSSLGYYETLDAKAALDFALTQPDVKHIGAWGGSMGAVTMIRAAAKYPQIEALVADSPFATLEDEMDLRIPFPMMRSLIHFFAEQETGVDPSWVRPVDDIAAVSPRPVFIIQGLRDGMVPLDSAQRLYEAAGEPRELWEEKDVPHLNMYAYYKIRYTKRVIKFFDQYLLGK
jgi:fermentation-respiration switch protein FrsA (DUF1100 family)